MKADLRFIFWPLMLLTLIVVVPETNAAEDEEEVAGVSISRSDGRRMQLLVEEGNFELHFFNEEDEQETPDAAQAILHCTSRVVNSRQTLALLAVEKDDATILSSPRVIRPPYQFDILLVLNFDDEEKKPESYHLVFIQSD